MKASIAINSQLARRHPFLTEQINMCGWEIIAHGVDIAHLHHGALDETSELAQIKNSLGTFA